VRQPDWQAVLVGRPLRGDRRFLQRVLTEGGRGFQAVGEYPDPALWYQALSVVVLPSHSEGFSLVLVEALASGCCVVAAKLPHFPRWVEHGVTGLLYPPGDVAALVQALNPLLEEPQRAAEMGRRAAERAREHLGVEREAQTLAELYDGLG
jgi:mannosyltransferase